MLLVIGLIIGSGVRLGGGVVVSCLWVHSARMCYAFLNGSSHISVYVFLFVQIYVALRHHFMMFEKGVVKLVLWLLKTIFWF